MEQPTCPRCGNHNLTRTGLPIEHTTDTDTWQGESVTNTIGYTAEFRCNNPRCGWHGQQDVPPPGPVDTSGH